MAKVTDVKREVIRSLTLTLTGEESETLHDVVRLVGGYPGSRRRHMDSIMHALEEADVPSARFQASDLHGSLSFEGGK